VKFATVTLDSLLCLFAFYADNRDIILSSINIGMSFESCHIEYDLSRRQRLVAHFGVWAPYLVGLIVIGGGGTALVVYLAVSVSPWFALLILLPLFLVRGFIIGLVNVIFVGVHHMDVIVEENGLGYATQSDRLWIFLDGIIWIQKYSKDTWTISHHNGTVISIGTAAIEERYIQHMRSKMEWGKTPEGVQAVVDRGKRIFQMEAEAGAERRTQRHNKPTGGDVP